MRKRRVMNEKNTVISAEIASVPNVLDLKASIQRARIEDAERSNIAADLRSAEFSRLEILHKLLVPVFLQLPKEIDMFNHGLVPGERPRIYIDMVAFVEMSRDRRTYRLLLDTASGRQLLGENDDAVVMAEAITNYLGRRIVERDKALASDLKFETIGHIKSIEHSGSLTEQQTPPNARQRTRTGSSRAVTFILGILIGAAAVLLYTMFQADGNLTWPSLPNPKE